MKKLFAVLMFSVAVFAYAQQNGSPQKFALVIGNGNYTHITRLNNPVNDANDVAAALQGLGFSVDKVLNGTLDQMESAAIRLKNRLSASKNSYGFLFYAGHGVQSNGENYLIPVDANIQSESFLRQRAVSVQSMLDELNDAGNELNVVVLDACRDNPFSWRRSGSRGLSVVGHQPADSIIVFATSAGSTASDGTGRNGLFTGHLLTRLRTPGIEVAEVFRLTMGDVARASDNQQRPAVYNQFSGLAYLGTRPAANTPVPVTPVPVQPVAPPERTALVDMVRINGGTFMMGSPVGEHRHDDNYDDETQHRVTVNSFYMGKYEVTQEEYETVMGMNPSNRKGYNLPVENVSWYDALVFCNKMSMREGLSPAYRINGSTDPAAWGAVPTIQNAKWDAVTIVSGSTGYRLPTEAQWEYACRAGTTTAYNTGASINTNTGWYDANSGGRTQPVGQKPANAWGLYDMHGNVSEWCWDWWYINYTSVAQTDPSGASSGEVRVSRGGSCFSTVERGTVRSASRFSRTPSIRGDDLGFRLVRP